MSASFAAVDLWLLWIVSWLCAARWSAGTTARPQLKVEAAYGFFNLLGLSLVIASPAFVKPAQAGHWFLAAVWSNSPPWQWILVGVTLLGFMTCWWARLHLGSLWSGSVSRKVNHRVVDTGPYRLVRHPIYTGILLAAAATVLLAASPMGMLGFVALYASLYVKAKLEERFLRDQLGPANYDSYSAQTPMLIPSMLRRF